MFPREDFEAMVSEEWPRAIPEGFQRRVKNVALLVEDEPSVDVRKAEGLHERETLLGLYTGVPMTERGGEYGVGFVLPDTITLFQKPIELEAQESGKDVRTVIRDTLWHEVAHHFGMDEDEVRGREERSGLC